MRSFGEYFVGGLTVHSYLDENGHELCYRTAGSGHPVILLHGFGMNNSHWFPYLMNLCGDYQFIIPDLRGFGLSREAYHSYDDVLARHAHDVEALANHLNLDHFTLMGYSLGGLTTLNYLSLFGDQRLSNAVLVDIMPKLNADASWKWSIFGEKGERRLRSWSRITNRICSEIGDRLFHEVPFEELSDRSRFHMIRTLGHFMADATSRAWLKRIIKRASFSKAVMDVMFPMEYWHVFMDHAKSLVSNDYDFREGLSQSDIPVSIIAAANSDIFPVESQIKMGKIAKNGNVDLLMNSGHILMIDEPFNFYAAMKKGLGRYSESSVPAQESILEVD